jgi:cobalt-zinc-cadmium efflux system outer membrane protein
LRTNVDIRRDTLCGSPLPFFLLIIVALGALGVRPAAAAGLTVEEAIAVALENNPNLQAARQQLETARARAIKAHYLNQYNPQVQVQTSQAHFEFAPGGNATQIYSTATVEVEVAGQRGLRIKAADRALSEAQANVADAERLTRARAQYAFYQALYLRERLDLMERVEDLNRRLRDATAMRFRAGESARLEANLAAIRYDQSRRMTLLAHRDHQNGLRALQRSLGMVPTGELEVSGSLLVGRTIALDPQRALQAASANRPDLRARDYQISRIAADIELIKRLRIPNLTVGGFIGQIPEIPGEFVREIGGIVGFPIPLFERKQAELTDLKGLETRAKYERRATKLTIEQQVRDALSAYEASRDALEVFQADALGRLKESFELIDTAYRLGEIGLLQLIVVENDLVAANSSYLDSLWDYWVARIAVETVAGTTLERLRQP